jgi:DNA-binding MarR family transcriptional regulator
MSTTSQKNEAEQLAELTYALLEQCQFKQERLAAHLGLTVTEFRLLRSFKNEPALPAGVLAERFGVSPGRVTRIVDGLVRKRLMRRTPARHDRRVMEISLTPRGARLQENLLSDFVGTHEDILSLLPEGGAAAVLLALEKLNEAMREWGSD